MLLAYVLGYWVLLPAALFGSAIALDARLGLRLSASSLRILSGALICAPSGGLLARSVLEFWRYGATPPVSALPPVHLIQRGLYAYWRHPIYLFYTLVVAGAGLIAGSLALLVIVLPGFIVAELGYIAVEERALVRRFGDSYDRYRRRTPLIIPHLGAAIRPFFCVLARLVFRFRIEHGERIPGEPPFFVVATHCNYLDPFYLGYAVRFPVSFVTTYEVFRPPLSRWIFRRFQCIPKRRYRNDTETGRGIVQRLRDGFVIGLFPEGERSWTGAPGQWKTGAADLLLRFHGIPIVPVRLDGTYLAWPRWAPRFRRCQVTAAVQQPFRVLPGMTSAEVEREIRARTDPGDHAGPRAIRACASGIERLIYRCLVCGSFGRMEVRRNGRFACLSCGTDYQLAPDGLLHYRSEVTTLAAAYERIRIGPRDVAALRTGDASFAAAEEVRAAREQNGRLARGGLGRLELSAGRLRFSGPYAVLSVDLDSISSVTTEGNNRLQVYSAARKELVQFSFRHDSVLKWQDLLVEAIREECGREPNRR